MLARLFWMELKTYPVRERKREVHWIPKVSRFKVVSDDLKYEWWGYEILWFNLVIHLDLEHTRVKVRD